MSTSMIEHDQNHRGHDRDHQRTATPALAWGYNNAGGLGAGGAARSLQPIPISLPAGTVDVQGGTDFTIALTKSGAVFAWGGNRWGQLGTGKPSKVGFAPAKVKIPGDPHITAIAVGQDHVLALTTGGRVFAWGRNHHGQLGDSTRTDRAAPVATKISRVERIAAGNTFSAAITAAGALQVWGSAIPATDHTDPDAVAKLAESRFITTPRSLKLPHGARAGQVDAGDRHLVVLTTGGDLVSYGVTAAGRPAPKRLSVPAGQGRVVSISAGDNHTVALTRSGAVLAWGANYHGQLGNGTTTSSDTPVRVRIPKLRDTVVQAIAGGDSVWVRTSDGHVHAWGHGGWGQLGTSTTDPQQRPVPVQLPGHTRLSGLHAGRFHVIATAR